MKLIVESTFKNALFEIFAVIARCRDHYSSSVSKISQQFTLSTPSSFKNKYSFYLLGETIKFHLARGTTEDITRNSYDIG